MLDQKVSIPFCPTVRPTQKQFDNFYEFIEKLQATYKQHFGIVKVVPPKSWKPHDQNYEVLKKEMKVKKPIEQHAKMSKNDFYEIRNIIQESMNLNKFQKRVGDKSAISLSSPQKVEEQFWKTIKYTPPVYGADLHKSLMSPLAGSWNLGDLDSLLRDAAPVLIKGVTYPYCYVGTWKSIFCWHKEDLDLSAINYLHEGHEKYWYCIQPDHQHILEQEAKEAFPQSYLNCKNFLRHKTTLINPYRLKQKNPNLKISKAYQGPNEFMVVFSGSYHCGFNSGKNIAEAVNFATRDWLKKLEGVTFCECTQRSVKPDYKYFLDNLESKSSRFKNEPNLKHLKNWVINNGLYTDTAVQEEFSADYEEDDDQKNTKQSKKRQSSRRQKDSQTQNQSKKKLIKKQTKKGKEKVKDKSVRKKSQKAIKS